MFFADVHKIVCIFQHSHNIEEGYFSVTLPGVPDIPYKGVHHFLQKRPQRVHTVCTSEFLRNLGLLYLTQTYFKFCQYDELQRLQPLKIASPPGYEYSGAGGVGS